MTEVFGGHCVTRVPQSWSHRWLWQLGSLSLILQNRGTHRAGGMSPEGSLFPAGTAAPHHPKALLLGGTRQCPQTCPCHHRASHSDPNRGSRDPQIWKKVLGESSPDPPGGGFRVQEGTGGRSHRGRVESTGQSAVGRQEEGPGGTGGNR